jgi:1-acyl-sn-glycerol-3-phosphate acyltransferase
MVLSEVKTKGSGLKSLLNFFDKFDPSSNKPINGVMDSSREIKESLKIDVEKILRSKNPTLGKAVPGFVINYLKRIVHQDELNRFLDKNGHLKDAELIEAGLQQFAIKYKVTGGEKVPREGRYIFVSNHPLGGLDGLVFINEVSRNFNNIKFPVNDILMAIRNLSGIFIPVNKHGAQERDAARALEEAYASDCQILYFPAGLCSRKRNGIIRDLQWHKSFISKAIQHKRDIVPAFFSGRNSDFFYNLSNIRKFLGIRANVEMLYLADEMFKQKDKEIRLVFGDRIPWEKFDRSRSAQEWAEWVKSKSYELESILSL